MEKTVEISSQEKYVFHNQVDYCIGTGRMGLALQKEYQEQLKLVQDMIGFKHIRGHGLFCDDMAVYQDGEYNFTYLDMVMDSYRKLGLAPFIELGFMPARLASGSQTVFYWKGNTTPPKSYEEWKHLVQALLLHLIERYGREEVVTWPVEVWNEPNLPGFWENADMSEYFHLFQESFRAVKEIDQRFRVGGPAVCGGSDEVWIKAFLEFCQKEMLKVDFVTRHHYTTEQPEVFGHYGYAELSDAEDGYDNLHTTREIIDSFPEYKGLKIHITEFNTSYIPNCPLHDTNQNAAYIAGQLSRLGEDNESYSYWTFGDIFEEQGVPFTPFHGGFGLVANGCIPKPTFWSFVFYKRLKEKKGVCVYKDDHMVVMKLENGDYQGIAWNATRTRRNQELLLHLQLAWDREKSSNSKATLFAHWVDEEHCNPLKLWHDMGEPSSLLEEQVKILKQAAVPFVTSKPLEVTGENLAQVALTLPENGVVYFEVKAVNIRPDRGYSYERVMQKKEQVNPLTRLDYPDPDVIRVEDTYYMVSTTMHFMPGCEILRSYDLIHWEHVSFVYNRLDSTKEQTLTDKQNAYGKGMWAASLRYHKGRFYVCFVANDTGKTYLYQSEDINGPWRKSVIEGFYHDCSLLFEEDRVFIAYGNRQIHLTELKKDLSGPLKGGLDRIVVEDSKETSLGYEGTHLYKINQTYYLFFIHSLKDRWRRVEACFYSDSLLGEFTGGDILNDDRGYMGQGVAQGGVVDAPDGNWYSILFQDYGAVGRIPVLIPVHFEEKVPVFGVQGLIPTEITTKSQRVDYEYTELVGSDDFTGGFGLQELPTEKEYGCFGLKSMWQFNHEPNLSLLALDQDTGRLSVTTDKLCDDLLEARNILTQRMLYPGCSGEVTVDFSALAEGDYAGICALQGDYGMIAFTKREGKGYVVMKDAKKEYEAIPVEEDEGCLKIEVDFTRMRDEARFYYQKKGWNKIGRVKKLKFALDHFTGCRFGLYVYSTKQIHGTACFSNFVYHKQIVAGCCDLC